MYITSFLWQGLHCVKCCFIQDKLRTDIRIRIRSRPIRIRVHEACIRTIIRITAEQKDATMNNLIFHILFAFDFDLWDKAKPRTDIRRRTRSRPIRIRAHEARSRTISRITAEQKDAL